MQKWGGGGVPKSETAEEKILCVSEFGTREVYFCGVIIMRIVKIF